MTNATHLFVNDLLTNISNEGSFLQADGLGLLEIHDMFRMLESSITHFCVIRRDRARENE